MNESEIESKMRGMVRQRGGLFLKFISPSTRGVPDRIVIKKPGRVIFVELKKDGEKPTALQAHIHEQLRAMGCEVRVVAGIRQVSEFVKEVFDDE